MQINIILRDLKVNDLEDFFTMNYPELIRLGLSTWSESLGFQKEAVYRKARIVEGEYYDSISYGILKADWHALQTTIDQIFR